jgi:hypothetical protein
VNARRFVVILCAGALALAGLVLLRPGERKKAAPTVSPLAFIPAGAAFVAAVDVAELRKTAAGTTLSSLGFRHFAPDGASGAFRPLRDVDELVLAVAGGARLAQNGAAPLDANSVVVVARGRFTGVAAAEAAVERIRARGGEPVHTKLGSFESVRDLRGAGEVAARDGLFVLSDGGYLRAVLAAAEGQRSDGTEAERMRDRVHAELRQSFGRGAPVSATLTLPEGSLEAALGDAEVRRSPLALVRSAALRVTVDDSIELQALFVCADAGDCARFAKFLDGARDDLERALGTEGALRRLRVGAQTGERIELSLSLAADDIERFLAPRDGGQ